MSILNSKVRPLAQRTELRKVKARRSLRLREPPNCKRKSSARYDSYGRPFRVPGGSFHIAEKPKSVAAENFLDIGFGMASFEQRVGDARQVRRVFHAEGHAGAVEIRAEADVLDAGDFHRAIHMLDDGCVPVRIMDPSNQGPNSTLSTQAVDALVRRIDCQSAIIVARFISRQMFLLTALEGDALR